MMSKYMISGHDAATGEEIMREMTEEEIAEYLLPLNPEPTDE